VAEEREKEETAWRLGIVDLLAAANWRRKRRAAVCACDQAEKQLWRDWLCARRRGATPQSLCRHRQHEAERQDGEKRVNAAPATPQAALPQNYAAFPRKIFTLPRTSLCCRTARCARTCAMLRRSSILTENISGIISAGIKRRMSHIMVCGWRASLEWTFNNINGVSNAIAIA